MDYLRKFIREIPDFPHEGVLFRDFTPMLQNAEAFNKVIDKLAGIYTENDIDYIVGLDARGFIIGSALAYKMKRGFVPVRKLGKLPADKISCEYDLEYGKACVELHKDAVRPNDKVLVVDDVIATGGTAVASIKLLQQLQANIIEFAAIINLKFLKGDKNIENTGVPVMSLFNFE